MEAPKAPTGWGIPLPSRGGVWGMPPSPEKKCIFSFEMVRFDAFWRTFRPTVIVTMMFMTSAEV